MPPDLGGRPHMERDQAAVGRRVEGVRERHVERRRLHHQLPLRRHHRTQSQGLLWCEYARYWHNSRLVAQYQDVYVEKEDYVFQHMFW